MVVDLFDDFRAKNIAHHVARHRFASGVGIAARQMHSGQVIVTDLRLLFDHRRWHIHSVLAAGRS